MEKIKMNFEQYTLPSVEEKISVEKKDITTNEGVFWSTKTGKIWMFVFIACIALSLVAGFFIYQAGSAPTVPVSIPTPIQTSSISPTLIPENIDLSKYSITVLNGSKINREARKLKELLEKEGFTVASIGNAHSSDNKKTTIQIKTTIPKTFLDKLKSLLVKSYVLDAVAELADTEDSEVVITIGSGKVNLK